MYAVIKTGGKQYRVAADEVLTIEKIAGDSGATVEFTDVLMVGGSGDPKVSAPLVSGAKVTAEVVKQDRGDKVIAFKKRRRKNSRRKRGYRHEFSVVRITEILTDGKKPADTPPPRPKREAKPKPEGATEAEGGETETKAKVASKKTAAKAKKPATKGKKPAAKRTKK